VYVTVTARDRGVWNEEESVRVAEEEKDLRHLGWRELGLFAIGLFK
jgi:hypothetical protein